MKNDKTLKRLKEIIKRLDKEYPEAKCHLEFKNEFELLISTVLAAQCTDNRVNQVMTPLYKTIYKKPSDILKDGFDNFRERIKSITFPNNKAKAIIKLCEQIEKDFNGKIPTNLDNLIKLQGVGRKSANVLLGNCFGYKDVIIVDTHLKRVTDRLGLIENSDPDKIEFELKEIIPTKEQFRFSMQIGEHGRQICQAKKPKCKECILYDICPSFNKF